MTAAMYVPRFTIKQRYAFTANQYEIIAPGPGGEQLLAYAQQKRLAFREQVTFYTDPSKVRAVFSFKARQRLDLGNTEYDVFDEYGQQLGVFRRDFAASLFRSTFHIEGQGFAGSGQERSQLVALLRRFSDFDFLPVHFDFTDTAGRPLLSSTRELTVRDRYAIEVPDQRIDFRFAAAVAVGLDALMSR